MLILHISTYPHDGHLGASREFCISSGEIIGSRMWEYDGGWFPKRRWEAYGSVGWVPVRGFSRTFSILTDSIRISVKTCYNGTYLNQKYRKSLKYQSAYEVAVKRDILKTEVAFH